MWKDIFGFIIDFTMYPLRGVLKISNGGTGSSTAEGARTALSVYSKSEVDAIVVSSSSNLETLSGNKTLVANSPQYQFLNCNGAARDVFLPLSPDSGMYFVIKNTTPATYSLTVKNSGGTAIVGGVIAINVAMAFFYNGSNWEIL